MRHYCMACGWRAARIGPFHICRNLRCERLVVVAASLRTSGLTSETAVGVR